jgi:hypothetical protein
MSSFTAPLTVTKIDARLWVTERAFRYYVGHENSADYIDVPEGTLTDFASVPRIFWSIIPPDGQYTQAAVLHDYLYRTHERSRKESDEIFLEAMKVLAVPSWKRQIMFWAVRLFGKMAWENGYIRE